MFVTQPLIYLTEKLQTKKSKKLQIQKTEKTSIRLVVVSQ